VDTQWSAARDYSLQYAKRKFREYYQRKAFSLPHRYTLREWGYAYFHYDEKKVHSRNMALHNRVDFWNTMTETVPRHVYYSSSYFQHPDKRIIKDKGWMGQDLIFDIDGTDFEGHEEMGYEEMLDVVKREILKLSDDFLIPDFGISPDDLKFVFSGGRGYHVHITTPSVLSLTSEDRTKILSYVMGEGLTWERAQKTLLKFKQEGKKKMYFFGPRLKKFPEYVKDAEGRFLHIPDDIPEGQATYNMFDVPKEYFDRPYGWGMKLWKASNAFLDEYVDKSKNITRQYIKEFYETNQQSLKRDFGFEEPQKTFWSNFQRTVFEKERKQREQALEEFEEEEKEEPEIDELEMEYLMQRNQLGSFQGGRKTADARKTTGGMNVFRRLKQDGSLTNLGDHQNIQQFYIALCIHRAKVAGIETDAPVTKDQNRLIRLPGSLHGGTGLLVKPLTYDQLRPFDALKECAVWSEKVKVPVKAARDFDRPFRKRNAHMKAEEQFAMNENEAVFHLLRGDVTYNPDSF